VVIKLKNSLHVFLCMCVRARMDVTLVGLRLCRRQVDGRLRPSCEKVSQW
jgi:hypothetical protein